MKSLPSLLAGICLLLCIQAFGAEPVVYSGTEAISSMGHAIEVLEDPENNLSFEQVRQSNQFKPTEQDVPNLQITTSTHWARFTIKNQSEAEDLLLNLAYPIIDTAWLYTPTANGNYEIIKLGESVRFDERKFDHQNFIYDLNIEPGTEKTYYLRLKSGEQIMLPISLGKPQDIFQSLSSFDLYNGLYFGIVLVMLFYNLFLFASTRDTSYILYVAYILFVGLTQASDMGFTYRFFWPQSPALANVMVTIFPSLVGTAAILFMRDFLHTRKYIPKADKVFFGLIALYGVCVVLFVSGQHQISYQLTQSTALLVAVYMIVQAFRISRKGYRPAKFFLYAWFIFLVSVCLFVLKDFGVLPYNALTKHILQMGSAIELVLLSFALADRINILKKEKEIEQERAMEALKENERIITEQNVILEAKVNERTTELQIANGELSLALKDLKDAQTQLVDAEKMASLGLLTAGIAHEINNPINFVVSNINPLKRDIQDIMEILERYDEIKDADGLQEKLKEINELKEEIELDYVLEEIDQLLKGIDDGANRTADIVKSLKTFSRLDETDLKMANVNECLDSTLLLLNNSLKSGVQVKQNLAELKQIQCYPGKLNQLFMNIIKNALQAIDAKKYMDGEKPMLELATAETDEDIVIRIKDNGVGMDETTKSRIFEPFFTTKDVGEGTGLGLSIGYNIVEKHNGIIEVDSEPGVGTEFIIAIPKNIAGSDDSKTEKTNEYKRERKAKLRESLKQTN